VEGRGQAAQPGPDIMGAIDDRVPDGGRAMHDRMPGTLRRRAGMMRGVRGPVPDILRRGPGGRFRALGGRGARGERGQREQQDQQPRARRADGEDGMAAPER